MAEFESGISLLDVKANFGQSQLEAIRNWQANDANLVTFTETSAQLKAIPASGDDPAQYGRIHSSLSGSALNASEYRKLSFKIYPNSTNPLDIINLDEALKQNRFSIKHDLHVKLKYTYYENNRRHVVRRVISVTNLNIESATDEDDNDYYQITKILPFPKALDLESLDIYIENKFIINGVSGVNVYIKDVQLQSSADIPSGQMTDSMLWGVGIARVEAYNNGCRIYYLNDSEFTQLQWHQNAQTGLFDGVLVGTGEAEPRLVTFEAFDSDL